MKNRIGAKLGILSDYAVSPISAPVLLVSGFWRSGTTWVMESFSELLRAKSIFEPFHPYVKEYRDLFPEAHPGLMPSHSRRTEDFFRRSGRGLIGSTWVRTSRRSLWESFRIRTVVKLVNGQFCLRELSDAFALPVVHVVRSPYAVLASILRGSWGRWLHDVDLGRILPNTIAKAHWGIVQEHKSDPWWVNVALLWCISESAVMESGILRISYEDLCIENERAADTLRGLGLKPGRRAVGNTNSAMTQRARKDIPTTQRLDSWKSELSREQVEIIGRLVDRFNIVSIGDLRSTAWGLPD